MSDCDLFDLSDDWFLCCNRLSSRFCMIVSFFSSFFNSVSISRSRLSIKVTAFGSKIVIEKT